MRRFALRRFFAVGAVAAVALYVGTPPKLLEAAAGVVAAVFGVSDILRYKASGVVPWHPAYWLVCFAKEGVLDAALRWKLVSVDRTDSHGTTMLHYAAADCLGWTVQVLLDHGADHTRLDPASELVRVSFIHFVCSLNFEDTHFMLAAR